MRALHLAWLTWTAAAAALGGALAIDLRAARPPGAEGRERRWSLRLEAEIEGPGQPAPARLRLEGSWVTAESAARPGERDLACHVEVTRLEGEPSGAPPEAVAALGSRLGATFWITVRDDGALVAVHFPRSLAPSDRNLLQLVAAEAQVVAGPPGREEWTALERDGAGLYLAGYRRAGPGRLEKRRLRYLQGEGAAAGSGAGPLAIEIEASSADLTVDPDGRLAELQSRFRVGLGMPGQAERLRIGVALQLAAPRDGWAPELAGSLARAAAEVDSGPVRAQALDPRVVQARRDEAILDGRPTAAVLAEARDAAPSPARDARLAALFRTRPEAVEAAAAALRRGEGVARLARALGASGNEDASATLVRIASEPPLPAGVRAAALGGLLLVRRPAPEVLAVAGQLLGAPDLEVRQAAGLLAGAAIRAGRAEHAQEADRLEATLLARLAAAGPARERIELLAALGNDGGAATVPAVSSALDAPEPAVREAAARALRLAPPGDADLRLARALLGDQSPAVRAAVLLAADYRDVVPLLPAVAQAATGDADEHVRSRAVSLLRAHRQAGARVGRALAQVASSDPRPTLRRAARRALEEGAGAPP